MKSFSFDVLRIRDFRVLLLLRMFPQMALQAQAVIVGWQVYSITKDPLMLGLTGLAEAVPALTCALFAGHIVDTHRPYRVYLVCILLLFLNALALLLLAGEIIPAPGSSVLPWIFGGIFISGIVRSFTMPASFTLFPQIVSRSQIAGGSAWLSSGSHIAMVVGPAIAGLVYGGYGATVAWFLPVSLILIGLILLTQMSSHAKNWKSPSEREAAVKSIKAGWRFILDHPIILNVMALDMFAVLFGGAVAMLPAYADHVLYVGAEDLGLLRSAPAIGSIVGALLLAVYPMKVVRGTTFMWAVAAFGVCIIGFGFSKVFWLSMLFLILSGFFDSASVVIRSTIVQLLTPSHMLGRISSVKSMFIISSNELGAFESGVAARLMGLVPSVVFGGFGTLVVVATVAFRSRSLRQMVLKADDVP